MSEEMKIAEVSPVLWTPAQVDGRLKELRLPTIRQWVTKLADLAVQENWTHTQFLDELMMRECEARTQNRVARHLRRSKLTYGKTWSEIVWTKIPISVRRQMDQLRTGEFLQRTENVLIFGRPGTGKTLLLSALGEQLVRQGHPVCFAACAMLVQQLRLAKRELRLPQLIAKLGRFKALIIDDLGYVQQSREEMEVLFTLLSERYERTSVLVSCNLPFSKWEQIFKDPMTTAAAIDRLVHHSVIMELNVSSYRLDQAKANQQTQSLAKPSDSTS